MLIREFVEEDRFSLRYVYLETRLKTFTWLNGDALKLEDFDKDTKGESIWVCECSNKVVGFISLWEPDNFIHHLFILPQFSRRGYGAQLLEVCVASSSHPFTLKCVSQNTNALLFYRSKGWGTISKGISPDGEYQLMQSSKS